jgi:lipopolysaccharide cholinephosphotransferase
MLEILDEFVRICGENNFSYFLTAGTLLGAVRHKGFIPWDDDIDIAMPRKDYEKFLDIYHNMENTKYYLLSYRSPENVACHYEPFAKLCKKGTVFAENSADEKKYCGIWIDIWPYDNCILFFAPLHTKLVKSIWRLYRAKARIDTPRNKVKRLIVKILCCLFTLQFLNSLEKKMYLLFNKFNTKYISFFSGKNGCKKETHKINEIYPLSKIHFEGKEYYAPGNWELFLKKLYGNYMELPPVEQRINHNPAFIIFDDMDTNEKGLHYV